MFVTVNGVHVNMAHISTFGWRDGKVRLVSMDGILSTFPDPERELYMEMCEKAGVKPEENEHEQTIGADAEA